MKHITLLAAMALTSGAMAQINDGGFEAGIGAGTWNEASVNYGTPLCDAGCGNGGGGCAPRSGSIYAWFGGSGDDAEIGSVDQDANIPSGTTANLQVWVKIPATGDGTAGNYLKVLIDGSEKGMLTAGDSSAYTDYTLWNVPINSYADGAVHNVELLAKENGTAVFNILADDIALEVDGTVIVGLFENEALSGVQIYPNPANTTITLAFNALKGAAVVSIMDVDGKVVSTEQISEVSRRTLTYDAQNLQNGLYMVSVQQEGRRFTKRIVVAH